MDVGYARGALIRAVQVKIAFLLANQGKGTVCSGHFLRVRLMSIRISEI